MPRKPPSSRQSRPQRRDEPGKHYPKLIRKEDQLQLVHPCEVCWQEINAEELRYVMGEVWCEDCLRSHLEADLRHCDHCQDLHLADDLVKLENGDAICDPCDSIDVAYLTALQDLSRAQ